jgi:5-methylcytosine-specific restriction endonuclease McrA
MYDSLACFEKYLPIRDQRHIDHRVFAWRYHSPIVRRDSGRTCAEIAKSLEEQAKKTSKRCAIFDRTTRYEIFKMAGFRCMSCGVPARKAELQIDHIKPISKYPELKYEPENLQVLCRACNISKGNRHKDDLRPDTPRSKRANQSAACHKETEQLILI